MPICQVDSDPQAAVCSGMPPRNVQEDGWMTLQYGLYEEQCMFYHDCIILLCKLIPCVLYSFIDMSYLIIRMLQVAAF